MLLHRDAFATSTTPIFSTPSSISCRERRRQVPPSEKSFQFSSWEVLGTKKWGCWRLVQINIQDNMRMIFFLNFYPSCMKSFVNFPPWSRVSAATSWGVNHSPVKSLWGCEMTHSILLVKLSQFMICLVWKVENFQKFGNCCCCFRVVNFITQDR